MPILGDQALARAFHTANDGGAVAHAGMLTQDVLDIAEFDPHAAQLDHIVDAARELNGSVRQPIARIAGAQDRIVIVVVKRVLDELLFGLLRPLIVAHCQVAASNIDLATHADRAEFLVLVEDQNLPPVDGAADGNRALISAHRLNGIPGRKNTLRGTV